MSSFLYVPRVRKHNIRIGWQSIHLLDFVTIAKILLSLEYSSSQPCFLLTGRLWSLTFVTCLLGWMRRWMLLLPLHLFRVTCHTDELIDLGLVTHSTSDFSCEGSASASAGQETYRGSEAPCSPRMNFSISGKYLLCCIPKECVVKEISDPQWPGPCWRCGSRIWVRDVLQNLLSWGVCWSRQAARIHGCVWSPGCPAV